MVGGLYGYRRVFFVISFGSGCVKQGHFVSVSVFLLLIYCGVPAGTVQPGMVRHWAALSLEKGCKGLDILKTEEQEGHREQEDAAVVHSYGVASPRIA